jgi:hypothetical protein
LLLLFRSDATKSRTEQSSRCDLLGHVIVLNKRHLKRLMNEYVRHYHNDRTRLGSDKMTPAGRKGAMGTPVYHGIWLFHAAV